MLFGGLWSFKAPFGAVAPRRVPARGSLRPMRGQAPMALRADRRRIACRGSVQPASSRAAGRATMAIRMVIFCLTGRPRVLLEQIHTPDVAAQRVEAAMPRHLRDVGAALRGTGQEPAAQAVAGEGRRLQAPPGGHSASRPARRSRPPAAGLRPSHPVPRRGTPARHRSPPRPATSAGPRTGRRRATGADAVCQWYRGRGGAGCRRDRDRLR